MSCSAPAVGVTLVFSRAGHVAARVRTGAGGRYTVRLPVGIYGVNVAPQPLIGSGLQPRGVRVRLGLDLRQNFTIDTGIR